MGTRSEIAHKEGTCNPIFLFQRKIPAPTTGETDEHFNWLTQTVFFTREEAEEWGRNHSYNYPEGWRVYCCYASGKLCEVLEMLENG